MALKFLNKKGWHTGSLRNIETVWKAEQKHEGEQKKLEELRKQIHDEREKSEFRLMQEQAGLVPKQERLEFLYDSGLQVGKVAQADEYLLGKPVEEAIQPEGDVGQVAAKPGALFVEEKPASANDSWRKLHSDPLFLIKQQEQAAIVRITSNPVKMAEIKKAAEVKKKLKEEKKKKRKEAKRERREKKKRKKHHGSSSEDSSDLDDPGKSRKHRRHGSDTDGDPKEKRAQVKSRNVSSSPSRSPTRSPVRKDRRKSPRKLRGEEREFEKRNRVPSQSPSRSPVLRDYDRGRLRRDDSRGASKQEGRQREHKGSDLRSKEFEGRDSEQRKRAPSRSPSRSASRSPVRRDHDQRLKGSDDRDFEKRKRVASWSPLRSRSRSPVRRSPVRRDHDQRFKGSDDRDFEKRKQVASRSPLRSRSRSPARRIPVRRDHDQRLKGSDDRNFEKRKRVASRSPLRSRSRSPVWRSPIRRSPVRRDHDLSRSRRDDFDSRGAFKGEGGLQREQKVHDERLKGPVDRDYEKGKRARSPSRSLSRSPGRRRGYGQSRPRRDHSDYRGEQRYREHNSSDQRLKEPEDQDSRPRDTVEPERVLKSSSNGDFRSTERHTKLDTEVQVAGRKDMNGLSSKPGNKGRPPKPGQLSDAERAARLAEMQSNADVHEEQRWQRLKRAADADDVEAKRTEKDKSNEQFIADTQKSIFGAEQGKFSTIEKSVKRRAHFMERSSGGDERNAFRR